MHKREIRYINLKIIGFFLFLVISVLVKAQTVNPPQLTCISILDNNSIELDWKLPGSVNNNYSYILYVSYSQNGPYSKVDSFPYNQTSYIHTGISPYNGQYFYYMKSCSLSVKNRNVYSVSSDTLRTIMLNFVDNGDGIVNLSWNSPCNNTINGSGNWYYIYREYPAGVWLIRDTVSINNPVLSGNDTIDICGALINYRIVLPNNNGCSSVSNIKGKYLTDKTIPHQPIIDYVTVDTTIWHNVIKWQPDQSSDTKGYYIYKYLNPTGTKIDSVLGRYNTTYVHLGSNPRIDKETYYIIAYDSCNLASAGSKVHNSLFLSVSPDRCQYNIKLSWNPYINMESDLLGYHIYKKTGNGQYVLITTVSPTITFYYDYDIEADYTYTYYVKAIDKTGTRFSNSNTQILTFSFPRKPEFNYLRKATVIGNKQIDIKLYVDTTTYVSEYHLYRIENNNNDTTLIKNLFHQTTTDINIVDNTVNTTEKSYHYFLKLRDICNNEEILTSNIGTTILLKAYMHNGMKNYLIWNKYKSWEGNVSHYNVYRKTEKGWDIFPIASLVSDDNDTITYTDDVSDLGDTNGQFAYYVEAVEGNGNPYGFLDSSRSNTAFVNQYPKLFVPNAFAPEGYNSVFIPVMGFVHPEDYLLQIFDRWGAKIFETTDKYKGWDGTYNNSDAPKGVYVYLIKIKNSNNETIEKRGTVTLIR